MYIIRSPQPVETIVGFVLFLLSAVFSVFSLLSSSFIY